jgi:uncharacterized protein YqeY
MSLKEKLNGDLKEAMKAGQEFEVGVFRFLLSSLHNKEIEKKGKGLEPELSDEEVVEVLIREAKKRKESIEAYSKGNRGDLAEKETKELEIIKNYLPEELSGEEIEKVVKAAIEKTGAREVKDFGKVMAEAMRELKGKADASIISEVVKKNLGHE